MVFRHTCLELVHRKRCQKLHRFSNIPVTAGRNRGHSLWRPRVCSVKNNSNVFPRHLIHMLGHSGTIFHLQVTISLEWLQGKHLKWRLKGNYHHRAFCSYSFAGPVPVPTSCSPCNSAKKCPLTDYSHITQSRRRGTGKFRWLLSPRTQVT